MACLHPARNLALCDRPMPEMGRRGKPNPLAGFERVGCGVFMVGKAPTATGLAIYRALAQSANSKRQCWEKCSVGGGTSWDLAGLFSLHKKKKTDSAGSRSSFKEKGDKSCFTVFVLKQQACQCFYFLCNSVFCRNYRLLCGMADGAKKQVGYKKLNGFGRGEVVAMYFTLLFQ